MIHPPTLLFATLIGVSMGNATALAAATTTVTAGIDAPVAALLHLMPSS